MEDIYPLGQDNGLLTDIINFGLNNLYQYGQRAKESNQKLGQGMSNIAAGGNADLSDAISSARGVSPLYTGVINWAGMAPNAIAALKQFGQRFPAMLGAAEAAPQNITSEVTTNMPSVAGGLLKKPTPEEHIMRFRPGYETNPYTVGHEIQHSLNAGRVAATDPIDALTIGTLLRDILPSSHRGSLDTVLGMQLQNPTLMQRIGQVFGRPLPPPSIVNPDRGLMRAAMDEGLAYLGENAARPRPSSLVKTLADRMGVNWENPRVPTTSAAGRPLNAEFRDIGMDRLGIVGGALNPAEFLARLQAEPRFSRFLPKLQARLGNRLGQEFDVYRGMEESDPLVQAILNKKPMPSATAVTPDPSLAREFGMQRMDTGEGTYIVGAKATPQSIWSMVPQRGGTGKDITELLVNPQTFKDLKILDSFQLGKTGVEGAPRVGGQVLNKITPENLHQHLGIAPDQLERLKGLIPFHSDELFDPSMLGMGTALLNRYENSLLNQVIREKLGKAVPPPSYLY